MDNTSASLNAPISSKEHAKPIASVARALAILSSFDLASTEMGVSEIAHLVDLHKSTAYRLLTTLESEGFVNKTARSKYVLGRKAFELAAVAYGQGGLRRVVRAELQRLVERTRETAHLAVLDGAEILYVEKVESERALRMPSAVGHRQPARLTALGKAMLAHTSTDHLQRLCAHWRAEIGDAQVDELIRGVRAVYRDGYALDVEELEPGLMCVAAPVLTQSREAYAAVSIAGPVTRLRDNVEQEASYVRECCDSLSSQLGASVEWLGNYRISPDES